MPIPPNCAAVLLGKGQPLKIKPIEYTSPRENEITIRNHAIAINPVDGQMQKLGKDLFPWMEFPHICGSDVAGEVIEIGPGVSRFKPGDRVCGVAIGVPPPSGGRLSGGFQEYTLLNEVLAAPIPDSLPFTTAVVTPLCLSTAACGLYQKHYLVLVPPSLSPVSKGEVVVIWGGSTAVGMNAIQLAVASGYEVITTASPKNFEYVKSLAASEVFDYRSDTVITDTIAVLKDKRIAGAISIGDGSVKACYEIVSKLEGNKFVASAAPLTEDRPEGVQSKFIFGTDLKDNEVGPLIWQIFYPAALQQGKYRNVPVPEIVGQGLEAIQAAIDIQTRGMSAKKAVVTLQPEDPSRDSHTYVTQTR